VSAGAPLEWDDELDAAVADLAASRIFRRLEPAALRRLAARFGKVTLEPGQVLTREGQTDSTLWIVAQGALSMERANLDGERTRLGTLGYACTIGARGVFTDGARSNTLVASVRTRLLYIDRDELWSALEDDPEATSLLDVPAPVRRHLAASRLPGGLPGEYDVAVYRRHWIALARRMLAPAIAFGLIMAAAAGLSAVVASPAAIATLALLALALPLAFAAWAFYDYFNDLLLVTNMRVIHVEQRPFVDLHQTDAPLARIQDASTTAPSLLARALGYGTLVVQTAGAEHGIVFDRLPAPESAKALIFEQARAMRERERGEQRAWIEARVREVLGQGGGDFTGWARQPARGGELEERVATRGDAPPAGPGASGLGAARAHRDERRGPTGSAGAAGVSGRPKSRIARGLRYLWPRMREVDGERVTWRKHWWLLLRALWLPSVPLFLATAYAGFRLWDAVFAGTASGAAGSGDGSASVDLALIAAGVVWLLSLAVVAFRYEDWRNDRYVLTDEHVVDVEARPLGLFATRRQASIEQIQDVRFSKPNMLATLLNIGNVVIQTASESGSFTFDAVHDPAAVQREIFARMRRHAERRELEDEQRRAEEMARWIEAYHRLAGGEPRSGGDEPGARGGDALDRDDPGPAGEEGGVGPPDGDGLGA